MRRGGACWVYMVACEDDRLYTGISGDPEERFADHVGGRGGRFTNMFRPLAMIAKQEHPCRAAARREEIRVKRFSRTDKLLWASDNRLFPLLTVEDLRRGGSTKEGRDAGDLRRADAGSGRGPVELAVPDMGSGDGE